jgi:hypothetical protein
MDRSIDVVEYVYMFINPVSSLTRRTHRYLLPPRPHSTCPSRQSSSTHRKSTQANTTSTHTAKSTASCPSIRPSNWKACLSERAGKGRVGQVWRRARITIPVLEVGRGWRFSSCRVGGLLMMQSPVSRSRWRCRMSCCWASDNFVSCYCLLPFDFLLFELVRQ